MFFKHTKNYKRNVFFIVLYVRNYVMCQLKCFMHLIPFNNLVLMYTMNVCVQNLPLSRKCHLRLIWRSETKSQCMIVSVLPSLMHAHKAVLCLIVFSDTSILSIFIQAPLWKRSLFKCAISILILNYNPNSINVKTFFWCVFFIKWKIKTFK